MPIKIVIADDHALIAEGIKKIVEDVADFSVVAILNNGKETVDFIEKNKIDMVLLDINMPVMDGIECAMYLAKHHPKVKVVILSMHMETSIYQELIKIGVKGYMIKTIPSKEMLAAIKIINDGGAFFSEGLTSSTNKTSYVPLSLKSKLAAEITVRELEIIQLIAKGFTNQQIADKLFISIRTADTHRTNILKKLNLNNVASLIRFAFENDLIEK